MMGKQFAEYVTQFMSIKNLPSAKIAVIKANPEQSKHLETARVKLFGSEIDFVNLRSEKYASNSRIPTIVYSSI